MAAMSSKSLFVKVLLVEILERRQGLKIACPEEIAFLHGFITRDQLIAAAEKSGKSTYGQYLMRLASAH